MTRSFTVGQRARAIGKFVQLFVRVAHAGYQPMAAEVAAASPDVNTVSRRWIRSQLHSLGLGRRVHVAVA